MKKVILKAIILTLGLAGSLAAEPIICPGCGAGGNELRISSEGDYYSVKGNLIFSKLSFKDKKDGVQILINKTVVKGKLSIRKNSTGSNVSNISGDYELSNVLNGTDFNEVQSGLLANGLSMYPSTEEYRQYSNVSLFGINKNIGTVIEGILVLKIIKSNKTGDYALDGAIQILSRKDAAGVKYDLDEIIYFKLDDSNVVKSLKDKN